MKLLAIGSVAAIFGASTFGNLKPLEKAVETIPSLVALIVFVLWVMQYLGKLNEAHRKQVNEVSKAHKDEMASMIADYRDLAGKMNDAMLEMAKILDRIERRT